MRLLRDREKALRESNYSAFGAEEPAKIATQSPTLHAPREEQREKGTPDSKATCCLSEYVCYVLASQEKDDESLEEEPLLMPIRSWL